MQNEMYHSEPNLIAEAYRNNTNLQIPRRIQRHFDFLEISDDNLLLFGTSNLSGRIWSGSIWVFNEYPPVPDADKCLAGMEFESSASTGLWLDSSQKIVIGCDSGSLYDLSINILENQNKNYFTTHAVVTEHDGSILSIDFMKNKAKLISGSMDMNIKVWDTGTFTSEKSFCPAHGDIVTSVSSLIENSDVFISTSLDGNSLIWDIRLEKPASLLLRNESGFTASTWVNEKCVSLGSNDGNVSLVDIRMKSEYCRNFCSKRSIFRLKYNKETELLAVCADDPFVRVFHCEDKNLVCVYENDLHKDFVRGLAWHPSSRILYSCGWDSEIFSHELPSSKNVNLDSQIISNEKEFENT